MENISTQIMDEIAPQVDQDTSTESENPIRHPDAGMSTIEYAVGTIAAAAFAAVLYKVVTSGQVMHAITHIFTRALNGFM